MYANKNPLRHLRASDLQALVKLAVRATSGVTGIVEGVHHSVHQTLQVPGNGKQGQTGGITGMVYRTIDGVTQLMGAGAEAVLAGMQPVFDSLDRAKPGTPERTAVLGVLNGVMGNQLASDSSSLATEMAIRYRGEPISLAEGQTLPKPTGKILLMIHGLCLNDLQWQSKDSTGHGESLAAALGHTPVYLRYNSGLHISQNGLELARRLEQLLNHWPVLIEELAIVAHSMGGLVARSAIHQAGQLGMRWPDQLKNIVFLGTPHHGAPLERGGNWVDLLLGATPYTRPFTALGHLRSAGITDLRYGQLLEEDWQGRDRFHRSPDTRQHVPLPEGVCCYTVAATVAGQGNALAKRLVGDGLVPLNSALGKHDDLARDLAFAESHQFIAYQTSHLKLLASEAVTGQLVRWLTPLAKESRSS